MAYSLAIPKTSFHARSNSLLPARSHPLIAGVEDHLHRLKASEVISSSSASSLCEKLDGLKDLHEGLHDLIQLPSVQQALSHQKSGADEVLDGSLRLLDICGIARDVLLLTKESIQGLESSVRRKRGGESGLSGEVSAYLRSRKKINKMVSKCIRSLKDSEKCCSAISLDKDRDLVAIISLLREVEAISFSVLKSVLSHVSGTKTTTKQSGWSLVSKFMQTKRVSCDIQGETNEHEVKMIDGALYAFQRSSEGLDIEAVKNVQKRLQSFEFAVQELEEGLESIFRCSVKTRVLLLNFNIERQFRLSLAKQKMADSLTIRKTTCHSRSNSLPARSHPLTASVEDSLDQLKASEATSSSSASAIFSQLDNLEHLHEHLHELIQLPSIQRALAHDNYRTDEVLDGSLTLLDVCGTARDVLLQTKQSIQELESSFRRGRGGETGLSHEVGAYLTSRKKINKMVSKYIRNLKNSEKHCTVKSSDEDGDLVAIINMLREVKTISLSVLESVLCFVSGTKKISEQSGWSLVSKLVQPKRVSCDGNISEHEVKKIDGALYAFKSSYKSINIEAVQNVQKQLQTYEFVIQELEEGLEPIFRCLVKTRVSLLNVLTN
ncbi:hypothetical protein RJ640_020744 [Escallonia rubra]|uniref:Uncharacterized protein n=1 Tax=Escallonia rubra TaxID=112253 RepID=A0AA88RS54_9ASTE|nr:hypothetical protein RJ640_020744 [Escallonia rubra]